MVKILVLTEIEEILLDGEPFRIVHRNDEYGVPEGKDAQQARQVLSANGFVYLDIPTIDPEPTDDTDITALFDKIILAGRLHHPLSLTAQEATRLWEQFVEMTNGSS